MAHEFSGGGGRQPDPILAITPALNLAPVAPYLYKFHPERWTLIDGELLPCLAKLTIEPGINGVDKNGDPTGAKVAAEQKGWQILPWDCIDGGYLRVHTGTYGPVHLSRWERPKSIGNRVIIKRDDDGYKAFLRGLIARAVISPPDPDLIESMIEAQRSRISKIETGAAANTASGGLKLKAAKLRLKQLEKAASANNKGHKVTTARHHE